MLVLKRRSGQQVLIYPPGGGPPICIRSDLEFRKDKPPLIRLCFDAPEAFRIMREEVARERVTE